VEGRDIPVLSTPVEPGFRFDVYHQLLVTKNGGRVEVLVDGVVMQRRDLPLGVGRPGLVARGGRAHFDGVAVTPHYHDTFDDPATDWEPRGGTWLVEEGALHQVEGGTGPYLALKGDAAVDYEFTASLRWRDHMSMSSLAGVVAGADDQGGLVVAAFDHTIWPFARFHVRYLQDGVVRQSLSVEMPRGFLYDEYHTIRVVKQRHDFTFFLDGMEIAAARFPVGVARPGLYTEGARAAFDHVTMTRIVVPRNLVLNGSFESERWPAREGAAPSPWRLTGGAEVVDCCAYDGGRRLLLPAAGAQATQTLEGLAPGRYRLWAWTMARDAEPVIQVDARAAGESESAAGGSWRRQQVDFDVPAGADRVVITLGARFTDEPDAYVAVDNLYLFRP
jgi:hypothetical protein